MGLNPLRYALFSLSHEPQHHDMIFNRRMMYCYNDMYRRPLLSYSVLVLCMRRHLHAYV